MIEFVVPFSIVYLYLNLELQCDIIVNNKRIEDCPIFCLLTDIVLDICKSNPLSECILIDRETRRDLYRKFGIKLKDQISWTNATEKGRRDKL